MKEQFSLLSEEQKRKVINDIIAYFQDERGEEVGVIAAENLLDALSENLCKPIYNKGIYDATKLVEEKFSDLKMELDSLKTEEIKIPKPE